MKVTLPYPPVPEHARALAEIAVESALEIDGIELDYSVESLEGIDNILHGFFEEGLKPEKVASAVFCMVLHRGGLCEARTGALG